MLFGVFINHLSTIKEELNMRYYSTRRPVAPGTFPKPSGNKILDIHNYDGKTYCEDIGREAWGYIDYEQPLHPEQVIDCELLQAPTKTL